MAPLITTQANSLNQLFNPLMIVRNLWRHRELLIQFVRREVEARYRGSFLGVLWSFINPLVLLLIYTFVFGFVFGARWPQAQTSNLSEFALILFCGIIPYHIFSECVSRAPTLIISVRNYVKKVVFPLEILPVSVLGAALFHALISLSVLVIANLLLNGQITWTLILIPLVLLPLVFLCLGLTWFLASLGVFVRDINHTVGLIVQAMFFVTPIFYSVDMIPNPTLQQLMHLNPLTPVIGNMRRVVLWNQVPEWDQLTLAGGVSFVFLVLGYAWFIKTKKAFADVI